MNISQIEAVIEIVKCGFNMSSAAEKLNRSQSGMSRQIKHLELELQYRIFTRTKNKIIGLTQQGKDLVEIGQRMVCDAKSIRVIDAQASGSKPAVLSIATTRINAQYLLPDVIRKFTLVHPNVQLMFHQGNSSQCCEAVISGDADFAVAAVPDEVSEKSVAIPAFKLSRCVVVPKGHPIEREKVITLQMLAEYPLLTFAETYPSSSAVDEAFSRNKLNPRFVCSGLDPEVCKTYVGLGIGIAILVKITFDKSRDVKLTALDTGTLFKPATLALVFRKNAYFGEHLRSFIRLFAPHMNMNLVRRAIETGRVPPALQEARISKP